MRSPRLLGCLLLAVGLGVICRSQDAVQSPAKRQTSIDLGSRLLAARENPAGALPTDLVDPFNPAGFGNVAAAGHPTGEAAHVKASDSEILQEIASRITPSGMVMFGGEPMLLFREKRLKVGDSLTITFEGTDYVVVISAIDQTSFKIRLNSDEITRPIIKPGKVP